MKSETRIFNGITYYRYPDAPRAADRKYFKRQGKLLHREVWKFFRGTIPDGYDVHHRDRNPGNNEIGNLELVTRRVHMHTYHSGSTPAKKAHIDRIRPLTKKWHASEEGRKWHSEHAKAMRVDREPTERQCGHCGKTYAVKWKRKVNQFCSNRCKTAARYASGVDNEARACVYCGELFTINKYTKTQTCSRSCANRWRYAQKGKDQCPLEH